MTTRKGKPRSSSRTRATTSAAASAPPVGTAVLDPELPLAPQAPRSVAALDEGRRGLVTQIVMLEGQRRAIEIELGELIAHSRRHDIAWTAIAWALGVTPRAANKRWSSA